MKDTIEFPIVGSQYCGYEVHLKRQEVGVPLTLQYESDNNDPNAIAVYCDGFKVGYVPNKGWSCGHCYSAVNGYDDSCKRCGFDYSHFIEGGLATRITKTKALETEYGCVITRNDGNAFKLVMATLVLSN